MLVAFTHHRPHKTEADLKFFEIACAPPFNFKKQLLFTKKIKPMFKGMSFSIIN